MTVFDPYADRAYRSLHAGKDLSYFRISVEETDLHIGARRDLERQALDAAQEAEPQKIEYIYGDQKGTLVVSAPKQQLAVGTLQIFIDEYISSHNGAEVDYIHGEVSVRALAQKPNSIGFMFDGMSKSQLFKTVICDGALPRKTFSMGHSADKRYYLECRKIK